MTHTPVGNVIIRVNDGTGGYDEFSNSYAHVDDNEAITVFRAIDNQVIGFYPTTLNASVAVDASGAVSLGQRKEDDHEE